MKALRKTSETDVLIDSYGIYLIAQLESREETKEIREAFEKVQRVHRKKTIHNQRGNKNRSGLWVAPCVLPPLPGSLDKRGSFC